MNETELINTAVLIAATSIREFSNHPNLDFYQLVKESIDRGEIPQDLMNPLYACFNVNQSVILNRAAHLRQQNQEGDSFAGGDPGSVEYDENTVPPAPWDKRGQNYGDQAQPAGQRGQENHPPRYEQRPAAVRPAGVVRMLEQQTFTDIKMREDTFLVPQIIVQGRSNILAGEGGSGKTMFLFWIAARLSKGDEFENPLEQIVAFPGIPKATLIITAEEEDYQVLGKLIAMGANLDMIDLVKVKEIITHEDGLVEDPQNVLFDITRDYAQLRAFIRSRRHDYALVILDPFSKMVGNRDLNSASDMGTVAGVLDNLAMECDVAVEVSMHLNKGSGSARQRIMGSSQNVDGTRNACVAAYDDEHDLTIVQVVKSNYQNKWKCKPVGFRIQQTEIEVEGSFYRTLDVTYLGVQQKGVDELTNMKVLDSEQKEERRECEERIMLELQGSVGVSRQELAKTIVDAEKRDRDAFSRAVNNLRKKKLIETVPGKGTKTPTYHLTEKGMKRIQSDGSVSDEDPQTHFSESRRQNEGSL